MNYAEIYNIPKILKAHGVNHAIIAPGSRSAPLTLALSRTDGIECKVIPDERSAGFMALGMSQQSNVPVVLVCTSGSAALNFAPAVAEAFYSNTSLIIFTADRPPEWIDQRDGQTIRQTNIYGTHVLESYTSPTSLSETDEIWHFQRIINTAIIKAKNEHGPVHINFPFREPLYPDSDKIKDSPFKVIDDYKTQSVLNQDTIDSLRESLKTFERKMIICGQWHYSQEELDLISTISKELKIPVIGDIISNIHNIPDAIKHADLFLSSNKNGLEESLKPDLLITFGKSILSKNLKLMLRSKAPLEHWHIEMTATGIVDTYKALTKVIPVEIHHFLSILNESQNDDQFTNQKQENYYHIWQIEERKTERLLERFFPYKELNELELVKKAMNRLPACNLHLANSMSVRMANFIGLGENAEVSVYCNRGTSGIDGSNSTAVGHTFLSDKLNILITGDLAFFYDRNAFWHNYDYDNLRIILLNNHGGSIFRMIKGPAEQPELEEYFETDQKLNAKSLAQEYGFDYLKCDRKSKVDNYLKQLFELDGGPKILELETSSKTNKSVLAELKEAFKLQK